MSNLTQLPDWLGAAVIGAVIAVLGYVGKLVVESFLAIKDARNARRARLVELRSLLRASSTSFLVQNVHARRLLDLIMARQKEVAGDSFDEAFSAAYPSLSPEEKALHSLIRGITIHSLRPTNQALSHWLKTDNYFKAQRPSSGLRGELAGKLAILEAHLVLWHAKFATWIPDAPEHALVYLADEKKHGVGFPSGIDDVVERLLA